MEVVQQSSKGGRNGFVNCNYRKGEVGSKIREIDYFVWGGEGLQREVAFLPLLAGGGRLICSADLAHSTNRSGDRQAAGVRTRNT